MVNHPFDLPTGHPAIRQFSVAYVRGAKHCARTIKAAADCVGVADMLIRLVEQLYDAQRQDIGELMDLGWSVCFVGRQQLAPLSFSVRRPKASIGE